MNLRPHQQDGTRRIFQAWADGAQRVVYQLPTGGGKTHIKSAVAQTWLARGKRVMAIAHRRELVRQISQRFDAFGIEHGVVQSGDRFNPFHRAHVCAVQTLINRMERFPHAPDVILIDEAHHAVAGSWLKVLEQWPKALVLGVTATPERLDGKGLGEVFQELICGPSVRELQELGYLAPYRYLAPPKNLAFLQEVRAVSKRAGDFARGELELAVNKRAIVGNAIEYYQRYLNGRPAIAFCVGVRHAQDVAEQFTSAGFRAASVDGSMASAERDDILGAFARGRLSVLTTADLISEGFDVPECAGALLLRPTKSLTLFLQQVGRALRPKADGSPAVIIDHAGNCYDHGMPEQAHQWSLDGRQQREKSASDVHHCATCYRIFDGEGLGRARAQKACPGGEGAWDDCGLKAAERGHGSEQEIVNVAGELQEMTYHDFIQMDRPDWTKGISISMAEGAELSTLIARADSRAKLHQIAKARGYKPGWVHKQWELRQKGGVHTVAF